MKNEIHASDELASSQAAAVAEVKTFLAGLKHRTPQEAIGMNDEGGLWKGLILGSIGLAILTVTGTVVPYFLFPSDGSSQASAKPATQVKDSADQPATPAAADTQASNNAANTEPGGTNVADPEKVLGSLGIGEAKNAEPDKNPREADLDNLIDGIK